MTNNIRERLESKSEVSIDIDLLQPLQVGLCMDKLNSLRKTPKASPIWVFPIDNGRYAIIEGNHRTYEKHRLGGTDINSVLYSPSSFIETTGLENELTGVEREINDRFDLAAYNKNMAKLPYLLDFITTRSHIHHVSDLGKNIFPKAQQFYDINNLLFATYLAERSIKL